MEVVDSTGERFAHILPGTTYITLTQVTTAGVRTYISNTDMGFGSLIVFAATYID
jgi:hypothetical protein